MALSVLLAGSLAACGGDGVEDEALDEQISAPPGGGLDNEAVIAEPAIVVEGLGVIRGFLVEIKADPGGEPALIANDNMVPVWEDVEGRIKSEDPAAHAQFETQFLALTTALEDEAKDPAIAAADALIKLSDDYLAGRRLSSPSPTPSSSPSATAIPSSTATPSSITSPSASPSSTAP